MNQPSGVSTMQGGRLVERALVYTFLCHGAAMLSMALLLAPMLPGGGLLTDEARVSLIAEQPLRFRLGWLPWHLTALSDLLVAVAFLRAPRVPRWAALTSLLLTTLAVLFDQGSQALWVTHGVDLAREASRSGSLGSYLAFESTVFPYTAGWAALLYTLSTIAWCRCLASLGGLSRGLVALSTPMIGAFLLISIAPLLPPSARPSSQLIAAGNAICFVALELFFAWAAELVMRTNRPDTAHGKQAPWKAPPSLLSPALDLLANSRFARALFSWLPVLEMKSDITDVIYVTYLVEASKLEPYVPEGLALQRLGEQGDLAMFTFLTYRHGHFGPSALGPLRSLVPSPIQSNWRTYVEDPRTGLRGIYFVTNGVTSLPHALGARLMTEGAPMHLLAEASLERSASGEVTLKADPGGGSAPDVDLALRPSTWGPLPAPFDRVFADVHEMLAYTVEQDRAMATQPFDAQTSRHEISLGITPAQCEPLEGEVRSLRAREIVGDARPICFRVPRVAFVMTDEKHDAW